MNIEKILPILKQIEDQVSQVRDLLYCPDGIRITVAHRDDLSYVEYWNGDLNPRIIGLVEEKVPDPIIHQWIFEAVSAIPTSVVSENTKVIFHSDLKEEELTDGIKVAIDVFQIKLEEVTDKLLNTIRERHDFNNYMSQLERASDEIEERLRVHRDNGLPNTGSSSS